MSKAHAIAIAAITIALGVPSYSRPVSATPSNGASAIERAAPSSLETVRWRGGGWRGGGWRGGGWRGGGWGYYGGAFGAGAILGGLLAAPYYYPGPIYYDYGPPVGDASATAYDGSSHMMCGAEPISDTMDIAIRVLERARGGA